RREGRHARARREHRAAPRTHHARLADHDHQCRGAAVRGGDADAADPGRAGLSRPCRMAPELDTPERLQPLLAELRGMEDRFHAASEAATPEDLGRIVAPDFWEIGASGRRYSRDFCLEVLSQRAAKPPEEAWVTRDWHVRELGP